MRSIILNADVGEEADFDKEIMPYISWCNIACGAHAGNDQVIKKTIALAMHHNVKIGAHPSYPDRDNFGRISVDISYEDLVKTITHQIQKVKAYAEEAGTQLHHVKPHGALYNDAVKNKKIASAIIEAIKNIDKSSYVITLQKSELSNLCGDGVGVKYEAFADRNYNDDLTLVSRSENGAIITTPKEVFDHVFKMVSDREIKTRSGAVKPVFFDTICMHGDHPNAVEILKYLCEKFSDLGFVF